MKIFLIAMLLCSACALSAPDEAVTATDEALTIPTCYDPWGNVILCDDGGGGGGGGTWGTCELQTDFGCGIYAGFGFNGADSYPGLDVLQNAFVDPWFDGGQPWHAFCTNDGQRANCTVQSTWYYYCTADRGGPVSCNSNSPFYRD